jgi:hypothetical protein
MIFLKAKITKKKYKKEKERVQTPLGLASQANV